MEKEPKDNLDVTLNKPRKIPTWLLVVSFPFFYFSGFVFFLTPIWLLFQWKRLNALNVETKISKITFIANEASIWIVLFGSSFLGGMEELTKSGGDIVFVIPGLIFLITYVIILFKICAMLAEYSKKNEKNLSVGGLGTWFLGMFYLQYKINKLF